MIIAGKRRRLMLVARPFGLLILCYIHFMHLSPCFSYFVSFLVGVKILEAEIGEKHHRLVEVLVSFSRTTPIANSIT